MPLDEETRRRRQRGGRVDSPGDFPEAGTDYKHMTPGERVAALIHLSRLAYSFIPADDDRRRLQGLPNRLIGGRR